MKFKVNINMHQYTSLPTIFKRCPVLDPEKKEKLKLETRQIMVIETSA